MRSLVGLIFSLGALLPVVSPNLGVSPVGNGGDLVNGALLPATIGALRPMTPLHLGDTGAHRPLDLPVPGANGDGEDEDAPESIMFYGSTFEGDAFFWTMDKSCSMGWGGQLEVLKQEVTGAVGQLSSRAHFGMNAFGDNNLEWAGALRPANSGNKMAGLGWVWLLQAGGGTCVAPSAVSGLSQLQASNKRRKRLIVVSDGMPGGCGTALAQATAITGANWSDIPIDTVWIAAGGSGADWLRDLASSNGGTFTAAQ